MRPLIVANWKCNPTSLNEAKRLFNLVKNGTKNIKKVEVVICPPFAFLSNIQYLISNIQLGSQDCFWEEKGAYTGEVSPIMLKNLGVKYVIIGHSERRRHLSETDEMINKKIRAVLEVGLTPILCIGETRDERDKEETENVLQNQITLALRNVSSSKLQASRIVIAYEPIWAIGTGNPCDTEEAQKMSLLIRKIISKIYSNRISKNIRIIYGGSVNRKNAQGYIKEAGLQGLLAGGASLDAEEFISIVKSVA